MCLQPHRSPTNLRNILVRSKLTYPPKEPKPKGGINLSKICHNTNCRYCPKLDHSGLIQSTTTGRTFIVPSQITCKFNYLIYLITCKNCKFQYVGQPVNSIQMRSQKHLKDVEHCSIFFNRRKWFYYPQWFGIQGKQSGGFQLARQLSRHTLIYFYN